VDVQETNPMSASDAAQTVDSGRRPVRRRSIATAILVGSAIGLAAAMFLIVTVGPRDRVEDFAGPISATADAVWAAGTRPAPDFTLTNQDGRAVPLSSLRGRVVLLAFLDSRCTHLCRIEGPSLGVVQRTLPKAERPVIVAVSVNVEDTAASVHAAARKWGWSPDDWKWLMGNPEQLADVWAAYGVDVQQTLNDVLHTGVLYVIDQGGDERAGYATPFDQRRVTRFIRSLEGTAS
jgi:cytochrome oxidase Cu insertion factor (SCO1/SenC/PrrC family)